MQVWQTASYALGLLFGDDGKTRYVPLLVLVLVCAAFAATLRDLKLHCLRVICPTSALRAC